MNTSTQPEGWGIWMPEGRRYTDLWGAAPVVPGDTLKAGALSYGLTDHRAVSLSSRVET